MGLRDQGRARSNTIGSDGQVAGERQVRRQEGEEDRDGGVITRCPGLE